MIRKVLAVLATATAATALGFAAATPVPAWCGTPQAEPSCPTTTTKAPPVYPSTPTTTTTAPSTTTTTSPAAPPVAPPPVRVPPTFTG